MNEILINVLFLLVVLLITQHVLEVYTKKPKKSFISTYTFIAGMLSIFFTVDYLH